MSWTERNGLATVAVPFAVLAGGLALAAGATGVAGSHAMWFAARASGLVAYVLATASVLFGLASTIRAGHPKPGLGAVTDIHRALSLLTLAAIGGHVLFLALDSYARFGALDLLVPFVSWYRPAWTGLGVLAAYLSLAVYASFYVRSLIGYRAWRAFHFAAFGVFALGTVHGVLAGTDAETFWAGAIYAAAIASVALVGAYRLLRGSGARPVWALDESSGNLGAARAVMAAGLLFAAVVLPMWTMSQGTADPTSAGRPVAAVEARGSSSRDDGEGAGDDRRVREREGDGEDEGERD